MSPHVPTVTKVHKDLDSITLYFGDRRDMFGDNVWSLNPCVQGDRRDMFGDNVMESPNHVPTVTKVHKDLDSILVYFVTVGTPKTTMESKSLCTLVTVHMFGDNMMESKSLCTLVTKVHKDLDSIGDMSLQVTKVHKFRLHHGV